MQDIKKYFDKAKLPLFLTNKSIGSFRDNEVGNKIFQMTIDRPGNKEFFRIFRGGGNDVRVLDLDPKKSQLLLYVKEPKRIFKTVRYDADKGKNVDDTRTTPEGIRRYLMGMDERHLFISELPDNVGKVNNVNDAFRILKPRAVKDRKKRKKVKVHRQGEWFFVKATPAELIAIKEKTHLITKREAIPTGLRGSKPHIAEELLRIDEGVFIRGRVTHVDHKTRDFLEWHRVFKNTEKIISNASAILGWID